MPQLDPFLRARLEGNRFEKHAIPLDVLRDLSVLEDMAIEVAKWRYLSDHPERSRTPRGFMDGVSLSLSAIEEGSAIAAIDMQTESAELIDDAVVYFEKARDSILGVIGAAERSQSIEDVLPGSMLTYFNRFGRSLRDEETLVLYDPEADAIGVRLNQNIRRSLVFASEQVKQYSKEAILRGTVPEADQERQTFQIQLVNGSRVQAKLEPVHSHTILRAFNNYHSGQKIAVQGVGTYDRTDRLQMLESVDHVSELESLDIGARIDELKLLRNGWLDGRGKAPSSNDLDWTRDVLESHIPENVPLPHLYPTEEGGVEAEWTMAGREISVEFDLTGRSALWHELDTSAGTEFTHQLNLAVQEDLAWIERQLDRL